MITGSEMRGDAEMRMKSLSGRRPHGEQGWPKGHRASFSAGRVRNLIQALGVGGGVGTRVQEEMWALE